MTIARRGLKVRIRVCVRLMWLVRPRSRAVSSGNVRVLDLPVSSRSFVPFLENL